MPEVEKIAYSINETARRASVGRDAIYAAINRGELRAAKLGKRSLVLDADLRAYLASLPALGPKASSMVSSAWKFVSSSCGNSAKSS